MKIRCLNNGEHGEFNITIGKEYEVIDVDKVFYYIINDQKGQDGYSKDRFDVIEEGEIMSNNKIQSEINELKEKIKQLENELHKKIEEENKKKWWTPKMGEECYRIDSLGYVTPYLWNNNNVDEDRYIFSNIFKTKEQAEREVFERQLRFKLKKFAHENNKEEINWNNSNQPKCSIYYSHSRNKIDYTYDYISRQIGVVFFTSKEVVEKAIEIFKDDLIRYFTTDK